MAQAPQAQNWPPKDGDNWLDLEYSGCFYCDRPWDHEIMMADGATYLCLDCYERRYGRGATEHERGQRPE
jgi:hypothetical protein